MDRKASPDNHVRRVMDASLPGLEDDPWFEERVLRRIREGKKKPKDTPRKRPQALIVALALVLTTALAVTVSLTQGRERAPSIVAAALPEEKSPGFADVSVSSPALCKTGHICAWEWQNTHQDCYRYYDGAQDVLCAKMIQVCRLCGKTNGFSYVAIPDAPLAAHAWVVYDAHREGTTIHEFYKVCARCRTRWATVELPCSGARGIHIDPRYFDAWQQ